MVVDQLETFNRAVGLPVAVPRQSAPGELMNMHGQRQKSRGRKSSLYFAS